MKKTFRVFPFIFSMFCFFSAAAMSEERPVRIGYLQSDIHQLACWVALEKGFYKSQGVDVEVAGIFRAGPEEMSAFAAGELDMGYVGEAPATTAVANGTVKASVLAQVNTEGSAIVIRPDSPIRDVRDLRGKRVAVPGHSTVQDFLLRKALVKASLDAGDVNIIVLKPPEMIDALRTSQIDAFIAWEPYPAKARSMSAGTFLVTSGRIWKGHPCCVLVADNAFMEKHPDRVARFIRAHVMATDFINSHFEEAAEIGVKYTGMDEKTIKLAMKNVHYTYDLSVEGEREYVGFLSEVGYIDIEDADAFTEKFLVPDILEKVTGQ